MPPISRIKSGTSRVRKTAVAAIRQRFWVLAVTILFICLPVYAMAWPLNVFDNIASSITVTVAVSAMPVATLLSPPERLTFRSYQVWFSVFSFMALLLFIGDEYESQFITFSVILVGFGVAICLGLLGDSPSRADSVNGFCTRAVCVDDLLDRRVVHQRRRLQPPTGTFARHLVRRRNLGARRVFDVESRSAIQRWQDFRTRNAGIGNDHALSTRRTRRDCYSSLTWDSAEYGPPHP